MVKTGDVCNSFRPDPCLVAILLVCQTRSGSGPQLAYQWPIDPLDQPKADRDGADELDELGQDESTDDTDYSSTDDDFPSHANNHKFPDDTNNPLTFNATLLDKNSSTKTDNHTDDARPRKKTILGLDEDGLLSLLAPDRSWHKRKFEMSIDNLTFVGRPVFSKQDGSWRKPKAMPDGSQRVSSLQPGHETEDDEDHRTESDEDVTKILKPSALVKSELIMFHVVFVMNTSPLDHSLRVKEMYDNVIKKFSRALKWAQVRKDYVWQQIDILLSTGHGSDSETSTPQSKYCNELLQSSVLARAIANVFNAISASKIASVVLLPGVSLSMQIPPVTSTSYLPSLTEKPLRPGLWLTTATEAPANEVNADKHAAPSTSLLAKSYTLLLKSPPHRIAKDAQTAGGPFATHLPKFVAALRPTKSFYKLSNSAQISLTDVHLLAEHLIYWRRAIAIPPLHQRDTYIVSPNADFRKIREACKSYEAQFPASLPSLPKLLSDLSGIPRPFGTLIPSPDHKDIYMLVLAWLMRNGWVTQLRTFGYIRVDSEVKKLAKERERETRSSVSQSFNSTNDLSGFESKELGHPPRPSFVSRQSSDGRQSLRDKPTDKVASLIRSPQKADSEESRWLTYLYDNLLEENGPLSDLSEEERDELHHYWPILSRHFDGTTALENVPIKENLKRKLAWDLYGKYGLNFERGVEDYNGTNKSIMVIFRHW